MSDYKIIREYGRGMEVFEEKVKAAMRNDWQPIGAPFYRADSNEWCQAMQRQDAHAPAGQVKLREGHR